MLVGEAPPNGDCTWSSSRSSGITKFEDSTVMTGALNEVELVGENFSYFGVFFETALVS